MILFLKKEEVGEGGEAHAKRRRREGEEMGDGDSFFLKTLVSFCLASLREKTPESLLEGRGSRIDAKRKSVH